MAVLPTTDLVAGAAGTEVPDAITWFHALRDTVGRLPGVQAQESLVIASGAISPTKGSVQVDTEGSASTDVLDTIVGATSVLPIGTLIWINTVDSSRVVTITHRTSGSGHIMLRDSADLVMAHQSMMLAVQRVSTDRWIERFRWYGSNLSAARAFLNIKDTATFDLATVSSSKAGTATNELMSPARTKDALTAVGLMFGQHTAVLGSALAGTHKAMIGRASDVVTVSLDELYNYLFKPHYSSGQLPLTSGQVVAPHGLVTAPIRYRWRLVCVTAQDLIPAGRIITDWEWQTEQDNHDGYMMSLDDTNFYFTFKEMRYFPDSMGNSLAITLANWRLEIYAWKNTT